MRILSKRKDYYDFISHQFGADPNCVYLRGKLPETRIEIAADLPFTNLLDYQKTQGKIDLSYVVAGMMVFPMIGRSAGYLRWDWFPYDRDKHAGWFRMDTSGDYMEPAPFTEAQLKTLIRAVGVPVFHALEIDYAYGKPGMVVSLAEYPPVLKDFGIPALVDPKQMWQNIYTTLTSVLRRDPDKEPPCTIGNDDRVEAAGFDLKTSFRHPVKLRELK